MTNGYTTIFEASYHSSNAWFSWLRIFSFYAMVVVVVYFYRRSQRPGNKQRPASILVLCAWCILFLGANTLTLYWRLREARIFTTALANNQCGMAEGTVQVLHEEGHGTSNGELIRVNDKEFTYYQRAETLRYHETIAHGGKLTNGAVVRLHYFETAILKVEIKN